MARIDPGQIAGGPVGVDAISPGFVIGGGFVIVPIVQHAPRTVVRQDLPEGRHFVVFPVDRSGIRAAKEEIRGGIFSGRHRVQGDLPHAIRRFADVHPPFCIFEHPDASVFDVFVPLGQIEDIAAFVRVEEQASGAVYAPLRRPVPRAAAEKAQFHAAADSLENRDGIAAGLRPQRTCENGIAVVQLVVTGVQHRVPVQLVAEFRDPHRNVVHFELPGRSGGHRHCGIIRRQRTLYRFFRSRIRTGAQKRRQKQYRYEDCNGSASIHCVPLPHRISILLYHQLPRFVSPAGRLQRRPLRDIIKC